MLAELPRERENGLVAPPALVALDAVTLVKALRLGEASVNICRMTVRPTMNSARRDLRQPPAALPVALPGR